MSQALQDARKYEQEAELQVKAQERPAFHLSPRTGWLNDPNGFSYYQGKYHLFYQYFPYNSHWGPMHWGHAVSDDLIRWTYLPAALAPDHPYDKDGCFSGSAITLPDGRQLLMYTGVIREERIDGRYEQSQCVAVGDGLDYVKYDGNPVITYQDLPKGTDKFEFRDPKMWQDEDGTYRSIAVCRNTAGYTQAITFASDDALHWKMDAVIAENHDRIGRMWECPDFFPLDGKQVLLVSAMDMLAEGTEFHSGNNCIYFTGEYDPTSKRFTEESVHALDAGIDFYAPQTMETPDGRRVMIGWMQNPDTTSLRTTTHPVFGQMSLPRELRYEDGLLYQNPVRELESYRVDEFIREDVLLDDADLSIHGLSGRTIDMEVTIRSDGSGASGSETSGESDTGAEPTSASASYDSFSCHFAAAGNVYTEFRFQPATSTVTLSRKFSGQRRAILDHRDAKIRHENGNLTFRLILDRYSAEVFVQGGEKVMTVTLETPQEADGISFHISGKARLNIKKYNLAIETGSDQ